ncbi:hypothetical protein QBC47DRAFT_386863 [Echria macrotheca]|uniref:Uncharacterized protein n=1 Tax=Echria macrotheca TaxID=438768 RepID=A0AAJ0B8I6_9PEZI|nr:hypothetical protein QBC47DRAFT_386863 [Echria macrotheca]
MKFLTQALAAMAILSSFSAATSTSESARDVGLRLMAGKTSGEFLVLGADGVLRLYAPDGATVVDAAPLDPDQIEEVAGRGRAIPEVRAVMPDFSGVDGRRVSQEQLFDQAPGFAAAMSERGPDSLTTAVSPLTRRQDCGNVICRTIATCKSNGCVFCFFFVPGIGACV